MIKDLAAELSCAMLIWQDISVLSLSAQMVLTAFGKDHLSLKTANSNPFLKN